MPTMLYPDSCCSGLQYLGVFLLWDFVSSKEADSNLYCVHNMIYFPKDMRVHLHVCMNACMCAWVCTAVCVYACKHLYEAEGELQGRVFA